MSVSPNSSSRRASLDNSNLLEVHENYLDSSRSTSPEHDSATSTISSQAQTAPYEEPEPFIVKIVKDAFRKVFGMFRFGEKKTEASAELVLHPVAQDKEVKDGELVLPQEVVSVSSDENEIQETELHSAKALLELGVSDAPIAASESHENEQAPLQEQDEEAASNLARAFCETDTAEMSQALLSQESEGSPLEKSSLEIGDNEVFDQHAAQSSSSESSFSSETEDEVLSYNQIFILHGLTPEERRYFSDNASIKGVERILERAESAYTTVINSKLRRYQDLPLDDRLTLALSRSRGYLKEQFKKLHNK